MIALTVTWHVNGLSAEETKINELTVLIGPGQDITRDVPMIIATHVWLDNTLAHRITVDGMRLSDVNV